MLILIITALLSVASFQLIQRYVNAQNRIQQQKKEANLTPVLVSSGDLEIGTTITTSDLVIRQYPMSYVQDHWLTPEDAGLIIGLQTSQYIERGEPLTPAAIQPVRQKSFSERLPPNTYAVTASISREQVHNGLLVIGDRVTLFAPDIHESGELLALQNIKVLAFDNLDDEQSFVSDPAHWLPSTITMAMTAEQAQQFEHMRFVQYQLWLQNPETSYPKLKPQSRIRLHLFDSQGWHYDYSP